MGVPEGCVFGRVVRLGVDAGVAMTSSGQHRPLTVARASKPEKKVGFVRVSASTILICRY